MFRLPQVRLGRMGRKFTPVALAALAAAAPAFTAAAQAASAAAEPWPVAGRLGQLRFVVVPAGAVAADEAEYRRQADALCDDEATCFLRFFANAGGLPLAMPLPDEVLAQPLARLSRSGKRGMVVFEWSCRVQPQPGTCF